MSNYTTTYTGSYSRWRRLMHAVSRLSHSTILKITMIFLLVGFGAGYVYKTNDTSTKGYAIADLEVEVRELQRENQRLSVQAAEYSAMHAVKKRVEAIGMRAPGKGDVEYVKPVEGTVARR